MQKQSKTGVNINKAVLDFVVKNQIEKNPD